MRILFVLGGFRVGGYEVLSVRIANALAERKYTVAIVSLSSDSQILKLVNPKVETYFAARHFKYDFAIIPKLTSIIHSFKPNIIMSCSFFAHFLAKLASFFSFARTIFVLAFHVTKPYDEKEAMWNRIYSMLARAFRDQYVAIHSSQVDFYNRHYGLPKRKFTVIYNGVDTSYFRPPRRQSNQTNGLFRIAHVATLKPLKDQWTLLRAMKELDKSDKNWVLKIVGADQDNMLYQYKDFVKQHKMETKIQFLGKVNDTRDILRNSDAFVLTSVTEALPLSAIEALSTGIPCILTDVGGCSDIIDDGKEGFLISPGDHKSVAQHILFLLRNPEQTQKMSAAARAKALEQFNFETMVSKYCDLFNSFSKNERSN